MILLLLVFDLLSCADADKFSLVVPDGVIFGHSGSSVVLPCAVSPAVDSRRYKVEWYAPNDKDNPILVYKDLKVQESDGDAWYRYRDRVTLIGELEKGNVSLKLETLTQEDRGEYICFVNSYKWYEDASVFLSLSVVGSPPLLSVTEAGEQVNVTCASGGWAPNTTLTWRDEEGRELRSGVDHYRTDSDRLVNVSSWLLVSPSESEWISCSVGLSDQEMKDGRVVLLKPDSDSTGVSPGWTAVIILLVIILLMLVVVPVFIFKNRGCIFSKHSQKKSPLTGPLEEEGVCLVAGPGAANEGTPTGTGTAGPGAANEGTSSDTKIPGYETKHACNREDKKEGTRWVEGRNGEAGQIDAKLGEVEQMDDNNGEAGQVDTTKGGMGLVDTGIILLRQEDGDQREARQVKGGKEGETQVEGRIGGRGTFEK